MLVLFGTLYLLYTHMLFVFYVPLFYLTSWLINKENRKEKVFYGVFVLNIALVLLKILSIKSDSYDASKIPSLKFIIEQLPNLSNLPTPAQIKEVFLHF